MRHILIIGILLLTACGDVSEQIKNSPQYKEGRFENPIPSERKKSFWSFLTYRFKTEQGDWPDWIENTATPDLQKSEDEIVITFINHASFLVELKDTTILFDPMFSGTAGPTSWLGAKRRRPVGMEIKDLPPIDAVFVSHNHYEHLDVPSLQKISKLYSPQIFVPLGDKEWLEAENITNITEMDWWQQTQVQDLAIHFVPAQHWSRRVLKGVNESLWGGYIIEHENITLFHAGDTGYSPHFKEIGKRFTIDVSMLPIGDYKPYWFMGYAHMTPVEAVEAHKDLGTKRSFGMHSETFRLTGTDFGEAEKDLQQALTNNPDLDFTKMKVGESLRLQEYR